MILIIIKITNIMQNNNEGELDAIIPLIENKLYYIKEMESHSCKLCRNLLSDPVSCLTCKSYFCSKCLEVSTFSFNGNLTVNKCPVKGCTPFKIFTIPITLQNSLNKILIKCPRGCKIIIA